MNYVHTAVRKDHAFEASGNTPAAQLHRHLREEVLPHFYAPSTRQQVLELVAPAPLELESDVEPESPCFTPDALREFQASGFIRRNRWSK